MTALPTRENKGRAAALRMASGAVALDMGHLAAVGLTPRECEVMLWICEGKRDREIAIILGLSARTVQKHVGNIFEKLRVETRTAAASQCRYLFASSTMAGPRSDASVHVATRGDPPQTGRMIRNAKR